MALAAFVHAFVVAAILLGIHSLRRQQPGYLLMGLSAIGCVIVMFGHILPPMPGSLFPYWRFAHVSGIAMFTLCSWLFLTLHCRSANRWFPKLCIFWAVLGPSVYIINFWLYDVTFFRAFEIPWDVGAVAMGLYPIGCLASELSHRWTWRNFIFLLAAGVAILVGLSDFAFMFTGSAVFGNFGYSVQVVSPLWFTALTAVLVSDFAASLREQESQRKVMTLRLAEQASQLTLLHEADQQRGREKAALNERQRIMQDIHDGLGSQLVSSLAVVERGAVSKEQISRLLLECIDDLRLAIDTMPESEDLFGVAANNLHQRMALRLQAAGISLHWDSTGLPHAAAVPTAKSLPLLRILQEAITNALKHAQAIQIFVTLRIVNQCLCIEVRDDGKGFDPGSVRMGKGLSGMEKRARGIGATMSITVGPGTAIAVVLPLGTA